MQYCREWKDCILTFLQVAMYFFRRNNGTALMRVN
nr:MAG TPA: hypothetical protein [Herelleviridae sp.]